MSIELWAWLKFRSQLLSARQLGVWPCAALTDQSLLTSGTGHTSKCEIPQFQDGAEARDGGNLVLISHSGYLMCEIEILCSKVRGT